VALIEGKAGCWRCRALAPSYEAFISLANGTPVDWLNGRFAGTAPDPDALLRAARKLVSGANVDVVAVDMPLATVPIMRRRLADDLVSREFGSRHCSTHTPSPDRPGQVSELLRFKLEAQGFPLRVGAGATSLPCTIEVYPHPAILALLNLETRLRYKISKARKFWPALGRAGRAAELLDAFGLLLGGLAGHIQGIELPLPKPDGIPSFAFLKRFEDTLDALVCAWMGTLYIEGLARVVGDEAAGIWIPAKSKSLTTSLERGLTP